jgi:hypothetical protein
MNNVEIAFTPYFFEQASHNLHLRSVFHDAPDPWMFDLFRVAVPVRTRT